jgi:hypothetical protein
MKKIIGSISVFFIAVLSVLSFVGATVTGEPTTDYNGRNTGSSTTTEPTEKATRSTEATEPTEKATRSTEATESTEKATRPTEATEPTEKATRPTEPTEKATRPTEKVTTDVSTSLNPSEVLKDRFMERFSVVEENNEKRVQLKDDHVAKRVAGGIITKQAQPAIDFLFQNSLTKFSTEDAFMANQSLRRDEASAFYARFVKKMLGKNPDKTKTQCNNFTDLTKGHADLAAEIKDACMLGLFQGDSASRLFLPTASLTNAQALTVLVRVLRGVQPENNGHFATEYHKIAQRAGLTKGTVFDDPANFNKFATRGDVARLLEAASLLVSVKDQLGTEKFVYDATTRSYKRSE